MYESYASLAADLESILIDVGSMPASAHNTPIRESLSVAYILALDAAAIEAK